MVMEILTLKDWIKDEIKHLREEYKAHPYEYPEVPGEKYYIVVCNSDGTPIRTRGRKRISPESPVLRIMPLPDRKGYIAYDLP